MTLPPLLAHALAEWASGAHYEAHEALEDYADTIEDDDEGHEITLALIHIAAAFHKLEHRVTPATVPEKLSRALTVLRTAPPHWQGLDLPRFTAAVEALHARLLRGDPHGALPPPPGPDRG